MTEPRDLVIGTAGHIDHGKTSLVRALTGVDTDRLPAELQRGITIDLGFASLDLGRHRLAVVDVPGHERFIRNMLAGASGLDLAMLVIAADDSVMPQTREHLDILCLLGLTGGVIALTKCDLVDPAWLELVEAEIRGEVAKTFLHDAEIIRTSTATGLGIGEFKQSLERLCDSAPGRTATGPFRMPIDRSFSIPGHGTVVTGTVTSGEVAAGEEVELLPAGEPVRIRGIQRHDRRVDRVGRGSRGALNLAGVHHDEIRRGQELAAPGYLTASRVLAVQLKPARGQHRRLRHRMRYRLHLGTAEVGATLSLLEPSESPDDGPILAQFLLAEPVVATHGQPFIVRQESPPTTLGGGLVIQPAGRRIRRRDAPTVAQLRRLTATDPAARIEAALGFAGFAGWTNRSLSRDTGLSEEDVSKVLDGLVASGRMVEVACGPRRIAKVAAKTVLDLEDRAIRAIGRLHQEHPKHAAVLRARVCSALADIGNDALVDAIIERLKADGKVIADSRAVSLVGHSPKLSQGERKLKATLLEAIRAAELAPPGPEELAAMAGSRANAVAEMLRLLVEEQLLVELGPQIYLDEHAADRLRRRAIEHLSGGARITMAELRDLFGTTRKYAIPIGEYLDRIGLTVREGDLRRLGDRWKADIAEGGAAR